MKKGTQFKIRCMAFLFSIMYAATGYGQWIINEGFESGVLPPSWVTYDVNNDGSRFRPLNRPTHAHSGNYVCFVDCYGNNGNDWLVLPQVTVSAGDVFNFFARSWYGTEDMMVKLSTTGNAISNFNVTLSNVTGIGASYQEFNYDLSAYAGQSIYLAIKWTQQTYGFIVDDVKVGKPQANDVGIFDISNPASYSVVNTPLQPVATVKNFGTGDLATPFPVQCIITDASSGIVYNQQRNYAEPLAAGGTDTIQFTSWTPTVPGTYTISVNTALAGDADVSNDTLSSAFEVVIHYGTGGPDAMGYLWIDSDEPGGPAYNWTDISATGTSAITWGVPSFSGDDNFSEAIPIGFSFPFYGLPRTFFHADINGSLLLADNNWVKPYPANGWGNDGNIFNYSYYLPGYPNMPALIACYWDDLEAVEGTGNVYFQTFGTAPARYTIIQWNNLNFVAGTGGSPTLCFQVILYENGEIVMQYKSVANGQTGGANPHDFAQSATIGIQNDDWSTGLAYLNEHVESGSYIGPDPAGNLLHDQMAIKFYPGIDQQPPVITCGKIWNTFEASARFTAVITDMSGLVSDSLYYNYGNGWQAVSHDSITQLNHYHYSVSGIPAGSSVQYYYVATDNSSFANRAVLDSTNNEPLEFMTLPTAGTEVLLMTPGNMPGFQDYQNLELPEYITALTNAGVTFDVYNWAAYSGFTIPAQYTIIFAYSNSTATSDIQDTLSRELCTFLDLGTAMAPKNLFFAADNLPSTQHGLPNSSNIYRFTSAYLRTGFEVQSNPPVYGGTDGLGGPDTPGFHQGSIIGVANSPIGTLNLEIPVLADGPDVIFPRSCPSWFAPGVTNPDISSNISFKFEDGPVSGNAYSKGNPCAVWLDNEIYKSFYISFDLSQLTSDADVQTMIDEALDWFTPDMYQVNVQAMPGDAGIVTGGGTYLSGSTATVTATATGVYEFVNWTENGNVVSTNPVYSFTVSSDRSIDANFTVADYTITLAAMPLQGGTVSGGGTFVWGTEVTVTAIPSDNYEFINWMSGSEIISTEPQFVVVLVSDSSLVAHFQSQQIFYDVTVAADPANGGTVSGAGTFAQGTEVTVTAEPAENFEFLYWEENGDTITTQPQYTFNILSNRSLTAHFLDVTGTNDIALNSVSFSPNPATDHITIECSPATADYIRQVDVYNPAGLKQHVQCQASAWSCTLQVQDYPGGIYFIKVTLQSGKVKMLKVVVF